jgi:hypothetical protein
MDPASSMAIWFIMNFLDCIFGSFIEQKPSEEFAVLLYIWVGIIFSSRAEVIAWPDSCIAVIVCMFEFVDFLSCWIFVIMGIFSMVVEFEEIM